MSRDGRWAWDELPPELLFEVAQLLLPAEDEVLEQPYIVQRVCRDVAAFGGVCRGWRGAALIPGLWRRIAALCAAGGHVSSGMCMNMVGEEYWVAEFVAEPCSGRLLRDPPRDPLPARFAGVAWPQGSAGTSVWECMAKLAGAWAGWVDELVSDDRAAGAAPLDGSEWPLHPRPAPLVPHSWWDASNPMAMATLYGHLPTACMCGSPAAYGVRDFLPPGLMRSGILLTAAHASTGYNVVVCFGALPPPGIDPDLDAVLDSESPTCPRPVAECCCDTACRADPELHATLRTDLAAASSGSLVATLPYNDTATDLFLCYRRHIVVVWSHWAF